jgi:hypothetical protein
MIISAGDSLTIGAAKYLNVFSANRAFTISSKDEGLEKTTVKAGFTYDLEGYGLITFHNDSNEDLDFEYEMSTLKVTGSNSGVEILNTPSIQKIIEPIVVTASATVEDGKMASNVSNNFAPIADAKMTILDGATVEVFSAKSALNRMAAIQLITNSATMGKIRIGDSAANTTATKGFFVNGHEDAPGGYEWETETSVFVHNYSGESITLAGGETWRA